MVQLSCLCIEHRYIECQYSCPRRRRGDGECERCRSMNTAGGGVCRGRDRARQGWTKPPRRCMFMHSHHFTPNTRNGFMIGIPLLVAALCCAAPATAEQEALWLRYPAISPDGSTLVFTYRGDLYRVPASGGVATQLTTHPAHDFMPVWSRDGRHIAFASDRHGNFDVFVMPAEGGEARRLTVHSVDEYPYAFSADGEGVIYGAARLDAAENRLFPSAAQPELYQ